MTISSKTTTFERLIGLDVGQDTIVAHDLQSGRTIELLNTKTGLRDFIGGLDQNCFAVCEATGGHEILLLNLLFEAGIPAHRADAKKVKAYIRSFGIHGKTDKIDARALARYAQERHTDLAQWQPPSTTQDILKSLVNRREELVHMRTAEKNRSKAPGIRAAGEGALKRSVDSVLRVLGEEIAVLDKEIAALIEKTETLKTSCEIMTGIDGVGRVVATTLLAQMPELGTLTRRQAASLAGCAPHPKDSGKMRGYRRMRGGRAQVKKALFIAALTTARNRKTSLGAFYNRLIEQGKKPMAALGAIMRKIIVIINARLRDHFVLQLS